VGHKYNQVCLLISVVFLFLECRKSERIRFPSSLTGAETRINFCITSTRISGAIQQHNRSEIIVTKSLFPICNIIETHMASSLVPNYLWEMLNTISQACVILPERTSCNIPDSYKALHRVPMAYGCVDSHCHFLQNPCFREWPWSLTPIVQSHRGMDLFSGVRFTS
jgi:hypothetical protein